MVKGAQTCSCSSPVLVEQTAQQLASMHSAVLIVLTEDGQPSRQIRRLQHQRPVGTVAVVMLDVDPKDPLEVAAPNEQAAASPGTRPEPCGPSARRRHSRWAPATRRRCQRSSVSGLTKKHDQRVLGRVRLTAASGARSGGWSLGRGVWRRSTAS
jgi:hypothetical protein